MALSRRRNPCPSVVLYALLGSVVAHADAPDVRSEEVCGSDHAREVRQVMIARNPNSAGMTFEAESALRFNRGLIIRDFLRLRAERPALIPEVVQAIDVARLRRDGDSGHVTADVCAVVRFMSEHYARPGQSADDYLRGTDAWSEPVIEALPEVPFVPTPPRPRPPRLMRVAMLDVQPPPVEVEALALEPVAIAPEPEPVQLAEVGPAVSDPPAMPDPAVQRIAQTVIADIEDQLQVPRYLSFREARIEAERLAEDDLERRREQSLLASERIVALLETLKRVPVLRDAVHASLGTEGRARLEAGILASFRSVPDEERARALSLWVELEAAAAEKR